MPMTHTHTQYQKHNLPFLISSSFWDYERVRFPWRWEQKARRSKILQSIKLRQVNYRTDAWMDLHTERERGNKKCIHNC